MWKETVNMLSVNCMGEEYLPRVFYTQHDAGSSSTVEINVSRQTREESVLKNIPQLLTSFVGRSVAF